MNYKNKELLFYSNFSATLPNFYYFFKFGQEKKPMRTHVKPMKNLWVKNTYENSNN